MSSLLFLTLRTFSATGGIEKVCTILGKALYERSVEQGYHFDICSMYDKNEDADNNPYFPSEHFRGFGVKKMTFIKAMVAKGIKSDVVILSHINLLMVGWLIKKVSPSTKIILLAHGIEIWDNISARKRKMLRTCDLILSVSEYTRNNIITSYKLKNSKCKVLNNCLDPFLPMPTIKSRSEELLSKYGFSATDHILMTLTRLSSKERYKGYDKVIESLATLKDATHKIKYLIAGSYDKAEEQFLRQLISRLDLKDSVVLSGYIKDEELEQHFAMADLYVMPSRKEGFGIVFIEAMYYGLPVIAGNIDGSVDALLNGKLGQLVNPDNIQEITHALEKVLANRSAYIPNRELLLCNFSYAAYKEKLEQVLDF